MVVMSSRREIVRPVKKVRGEIIVPSDKSITHRALILGSLASGPSRIERPLRAEDTLSTAACLRALGIRIDEDAKGWVVQGRGLWGYAAPGKDLPCGNSGTTMRLLSGPLAAQAFSTRLVGDSSLSRRPMKRIVDPLNKMGALVEAHDHEFPPLEIRGRKPLKPIVWESPVASAQVKSCLLLAGLHAEGKTVYREPFLSRDHTERMLSNCGVPLRSFPGAVEVEGPSTPAARDWKVPGDPSSAAYFLAAAALLPGSEMRVVQIGVNETRIGFFRVLKAMGADLSVETETEQAGGEPVGSVSVLGGRSLKGLSVDARQVVGMIDEIPIFAVVATQAQGQTMIRGAAELRVKESDRLKALAHELRKMGGNVEELPDGLMIEGPTPLVGQTVDSYGDHRLAMALAVGGLVAFGETCILDAECVDISFPGFWDQWGRVVR
jgi:3-phosphoshikimate 1-carboxyvinyltransferase